MFSWVLNTPLNYFQGLKLSYKTQPIQVTLKDYLSVLMPMWYFARFGTICKI